MVHMLGIVNSATVNGYAHISVNMPAYIPLGTTQEWPCVTLFLVRCEFISDRELMTDQSKDTSNIQLSEPISFGGAYRLKNDSNAGASPNLPQNG